MSPLLSFLWFSLKNDNFDLQMKILRFLGIQPNLKWWIRFTRNTKLEWIVYFDIKRIRRDNEKREKRARLVEKERRKYGSAKLRWFGLFNSEPIILPFMWPSHYSIFCCSEVTKGHFIFTIVVKKYQNPWDNPSKGFLRYKSAYRNARNYLIFLTNS